MVFAEKQEQNESYIFKDVLLQSDKSNLILDIIKEVKAHKDRSHWKFMKNSEVNNKHKNKYGKPKTILSIWSFKRKIPQDGRLMKDEYILYSHGGMQQLIVNYWETYDPVVNWIIVRSLLAIASIHEFPIRSIDFVLAFTQDDLYVYVFVGIHLGMGVDGNRVEWVLKLNKSIYGIKEASENRFDILKNDLERRGYHQSQVDPCLFYIKDSVILTYFYYFVIVSHKQE